MDAAIPAQDPRRRDNRASARVSVTIHTARGEACGLVLDLSQNGARLFMDEPFDCGGEVLLHWLEHEAYAVVSWSRGHECGVRFTRPLEDEELVRLSAALGSPAPAAAPEVPCELDRAADPARPGPRVAPALTAAMVGKRLGRIRTIA